MLQHLSPLQTYCLDEMGIERYTLKNRAQPYQVLYAVSDNNNIEQQNRALLEKIIAALNWPQQDVAIQAVVGSEALSNHINQGADVVCVLWFGDDKPKLDNTNLICLPSLEKLAGNAGLKKQVWTRIKLFKR